MERGQRFGVEREGGQRIGTRSERNGEGAYEAERRNRRAAGSPLQMVPGGVNPVNAICHQRLDSKPR